MAWRIERRMFNSCAMQFDCRNTPTPYNTIKSDQRFFFNAACCHTGNAALMSRHTSLMYADVIAVALVRMMREYMLTTAIIAALRA